jgi:hypothetical protein
MLRMFGKHQTHVRASRRIGAARIVPAACFETRHSA